VACQSNQGTLTVRDSAEWNEMEGAGRSVLISSFGVAKTGSRFAIHVTSTLRNNSNKNKNNHGSFINQQFSSLRISVTIT